MKKLNKKRKLALASVGIFILGLVGLATWSINVIHHTDYEKQEQAFNSDQPVVVMFYSHTCPDCRKVASTVNKAAVEGTIKTNYLNADKAEEHAVVFVDLKDTKDRALFSKYHVSSTPTFMLIKHGEVQPLATKNGLPVMQYSGTTASQIEKVYTDLSIDPGIK